MSGRINPDRCGHCNKSCTLEGHDACIGTLAPDKIMNACCGHGDDNRAYVQLWDSRDNIVRGVEAVVLIKEIKEATTLFEGQCKELDIRPNDVIREVSTESRFY